MPRRLVLSAGEVAAEKRLYREVRSPGGRVEGFVTLLLVPLLPLVVPVAVPTVLSRFAESTLRGRDSREPPQRDAGASARIEASVSNECRRRRLEEDASVMIEALSVRRPLAVTVE